MSRKPTSIKRILAASSLLALGGLIATPATAIPPPDVITLCPSNPEYQIHHWNMLYGGPQTNYLHVDNYGTNNAYVVTVISAAQYSVDCQFDLPGPLVRYYELAVRKDLDFATVAKPQDTGVLIESKPMRARKDMMLKREKMAVKPKGN